MFIHTDLNDNYIRGGTREHGHEPNPEMIAARQFRQKVKEPAPKEIVPIATIYEEEISKISDSSTTMAILPITQEINPSITKARQKTIPLLPLSCLFDIPEDFKTTIDRKRFLLCDETLVRRERVLIFASDRQLDTLFNSPIIYMDGTFAKSPPHFTQIYIIHAILFDICVPRAFCLLINKKSVTYRYIFGELKQMALERGKMFSPELIMIDFETSVLPVIKSEFPASKHHACFFRFCQAIYRQVQHLEKQKDYSKNELFRVLCRKLMALALVPREHVFSCFEEIQTDAGQLPDSLMEELLQYFENNWLDKIELWNISACNNRTNNVCEGYHSRMNNRIHRNHPNIWCFIRFLRKEEKWFESVSIQWASGATRKKNARTTMTQHRMNTLYNRHANNVISTSELLMGLSHLVAKKAK